MAKDRETEHPEGSAAGRYQNFQSLRQPTLTRARQYARVTIPALVPPEHNNSATRYPTPYQSIGARGVNNLANKLVMAMFPPNSSFFQLTISDFDLEKLAAGDPNQKDSIDAAFGKIERAVTTRLETKMVRVKMFEACKQLIVAGNVLIFLQPSGVPRIYPLSRYVVKRDPVGNVLEVITREDLSPLAVPLKVRQACAIEIKADSPQDTLHLYTRIWLDEDDGDYHVCQELNSKIVPGSEGHYKVDELPWLALRFIPVENEDYGRSYVEEYFGDLSSLNSLRKAILEGAAAAARVLFLLKPNATTNSKKISEAANGAIVAGNVDDIGILKLDKYADFRTPFDLAQSLEKALGFVFLLNSSVQRSGERVTAEEIRYLAEELESTLGGVYSVLSSELQLPLVTVYMGQMGKTGDIPQLPKDLVAPKITTGLAALGRGFEMDKLDKFMAKIEPLGPEVTSQYISISNYLTRIGTGLSLDTDGLVRSEEEVQQEQQKAQMAQMAQQAIPNATKGIADHINQGGMPSAPPAQ